MMRDRPRRELLGSFLVLVIVTRYASADIAFETYDIRRPDDADAPVGAFLHELSKHGYTAEPRDVMDHLGNQATHPAIANLKLTARQLLNELGAAHAQWTKALDFRTLVPTLATVVSKAFENPALVVTDQSIRSNLQKVLLDLALGYGKLARELESDASKAKDPKTAVAIKQLRKSSEEMMAEWIRTFSGDVITQNGNGPEAEKLYLRVRDDNDKLGRGVLLVTIDDADVQFYVNETIRSRRQAIPDLLPGRYRVLLMGPNEDARLFVVDVLPNQTTRLDIHWPISSNLVTSTSSVALVFRSTKHPEPAELACQLARTAGHSRGSVVLVGTDVVDLQWRLAASQYDIRTCRLGRSGYVVLAKPVSANGAQALARFIATGVEDPDVIVTSNVDLAVFQTAANNGLSAPITVERADRSPRPSWLPWATAGTSAAMFIVGGYFVHQGATACGWGHPDCTINPVYYPVGFTAIDVGVALGALSFYWRNDKASVEKLPAKWLVVGGALAVTAGVVLVALDQDEGHTDSEGKVTRYYWDTAPSGVAVGALGLTSVGVGVWSWTRRARASSASTLSASVPTLSASSSHVILGLTGGF
jgi:hypothetical protein